MFAAYFLLLVLPLVSAQVTGKGPCPIPYVQPDFNIYAFSGVWFELASIPSPFSQGTCGAAIYERPRGNFYLKGQHLKFQNGKLSFKTAVLRVRDRYEPARLEIKFSESQTFRPYWVLYTDYERYALVYTCENYGATHHQYAWFIGRKPYLDPHALVYFMYKLLDQGIYGHKMKVTDQSCYAKTSARTDVEAVFAGRNPYLCYTDEVFVNQLGFAISR